MRRALVVVVLAAIQLAPPSVNANPIVPSPETFTPTSPIVEPVPPEDHRVAAAVTMGGLYTLFGGWMYLAWYRQHKPLSQYKWGGDDEPCSHTLSHCGLFGWAGDTTYA